MPRTRLQKFLAEAGVASRRECERLILAGRISVNGQVVTQLGTSVDPAADSVSVDGAPVSGPEPKVYLMLHKPPGYLTTGVDHRGRKTVMDILPEVKERVFPVGRLDKESEGLLILTNDGDLALRLTHPRYGVEKEYLVLVAEEVAEESLESIRSGTELGGRVRIPIVAQRVSEAEIRESHFEGHGAWLRIVLQEGYKREVREMCKQAGLRVLRLMRVRVGPLKLGPLPPGHYRPLAADDLVALKEATQTILPGYS